MIKLKFVVKYLDGTATTVTTRPATEVAFERKFDTPVASLFAGVGVADDATDDQKAAAVQAFMVSLRQEWIYFLAWHASRSDKDHDAWLDLVDEIDFAPKESVEAQVDPTSPAAPAGS